MLPARRPRVSARLAPTRQTLCGNVAHAPRGQLGTPQARDHLVRTIRSLPKLSTPLPTVLYRSTLDFMGPWSDRYTDDESRQPLDLTTLTDEQLGRLAEYRGVLAASTPDGHLDYEHAVDALKDVWAEWERRDGK